MDEIWKACRGFEGKYEVSDKGRVRNLKNIHKALKPRINTQGYVSAMLYNDSHKPKNIFVHRLVAFAFLGEPPNDKRDVNHLDGDKRNNTPGNLEWTNDSLNINHAIEVLGKEAGWRTKIFKPWLGKFGDENPRSKAVIRFGKNEPEKRYGSVSLTEQDGFSFKHVSAVCRGERKRHGGYFWRFEKGD